MDRIEIKEVPVPRDNDHPPAPKPQLLKHEFTLGLIAPKGIVMTYKKAVAKRHLFVTY